MNFIDRMLNRVDQLLEPESSLSLPAGRSSGSQKVKSNGAQATDILTLDVSLSMDERDYPPSRLLGAKDSAIRFVERRAREEPLAAVGIVQFSCRARVVLEPTLLNTGTAALMRGIQGLSSMGATNIGAGLTTAHRSIAERGLGGSNRIVLLTDGRSNVGKDPVRVAEEIRQAGIQIDIIGIGGSPTEVDEASLRKMASVVNGEQRYWFINSVGELIQKFETLAIREIT